MAVRQYIGARYVPKFYEGTSGSEWDANVQYEPLTIVTYLNNTYTSKRFVPASVGSPMANPDYWVATGMYNEQLNQVVERVNALENTVGDEDSGLVYDVNTLKQTVGNSSGGLVKSVNDINDSIDQINDDIDELEQEIGSAKKRYFVLQGDSYAVPNPHGYNSTFQNIISYMGLTENDYTLLVDNSGGFVDPGDNGTFIEQLENEGVADANKVTDVVVLAGANDRDEVASTVENAVAAYIRKAKTMYPHCKVYVSCIGWSTTGAYGREIYNVAYQRYKDGTIKNGGIWLESPCYALFFGSDFYDYLHPSEVGAQKIAKAVVNELNGLPSEVSQDVTMNVTGETGVIPDYPMTLVVHQRGSQYDLTLGTGYDRISLTTSNITLNRDNWTKIGSIDDAIYPDTVGAQFSALMWARNNQNVDYYCPITIRVIGNGIYIKSAVTLQNIALIILPVCTATGATRNGNN